MPEHRTSGARSSNVFVQGARNRSISGAVAAATIPAVVLSGVAAAAPAAAVEAPTSTALLTPKTATPANIAAAQQRIAAHLVASQLPTRLTVAAAPAKKVTVKSGDTLSGIAHRHDMPLSKLLKANKLKASDLIFPGQKLKLSGGSSSSKSSSSSSKKSSSGSASTYTVKSGDTLSAIAEKADMGLSKLLAANNMSMSTIIYPGKKLKLSGGSSSKSSSSSSKKSYSGSASTYTIKSGDTLSGIAHSKGLSLSALLKTSGLKSSSMIYPGQKIKLSGGSSNSSKSSSSSSKKSSSGSASTYTVKSGDTLSAIAEKAGMGLSKLLAANNMSMSTVIYPGKKLKLSGSASSSSKSSSGSSSSSSSTKKKTSSTYTVKSGDTLSGIAGQAGMGLSKLLSANNLNNSSVIYPGQKLKLSGGSPASSTSSTSSTRKQLVPDTFLHYKYPAGTVKSANDNKYTLLSRNLPSRSEMQSIISSTARKMGVDPSLALAHAYQESGFNMAAVSPANAIGAMQVIPTSGDWASQLVGRKLDLLNPYDNATAGVAIIRSLQRTSSNVEDGIASYYQGQGSVKRNGMYSDTKTYVKSVKAHQKKFN
ncbi:MAG: LysM peptidoglycan-binding domain-containing protein [Micrococcaceae bacterium]|nr:LysM peptidoglycan-binding domain-containing protein [Micrococcaceae bacterium]MDN5885559.1 LysM peptidoglycan-binding domain-containing protein [Micrococcaceae bacterium]